MEALGRKKHPHLIELYATYTLNSKYHLIFPCANSNLRERWDYDKNPAFNEDNVSWSIEQMKGVASGLNLIHNFRITDKDMALEPDGGVRKPLDATLRVYNGEQWYGRHGDIKPENILWFKRDEIRNDLGVLKIADFGLGRFHGRDTRSNIRPTYAHASPTYEPPECTLHIDVSRAYDICIPPISTQMSKFASGQRATKSRLEAKIIFLSPLSNLLLFLCLFYRSNCTILTNGRVTRMSLSRIYHLATDRLRSNQQFLQQSQ